MDIKVKKLADSGELKELKYIFVDSLDVDPTFVRYEEDYNYCKSIPGLLEKHIELTPFSYNKEDWNEAYWTKLKMDLIKNFSDERMTHMRLVAKTFLAEKVERILRERNNTVKPQKTVVNTEPSKVATTPSSSVVTTSYPFKQEQEREQEEVRKELERKNREFEAQQEAERRRRDELRRRMAEQNNNGRAYRSNHNTNNTSKKAVGIAVAAVAVALSAVAIYVLLK